MDPAADPSRAERTRRLAVVCLPAVNGSGPLAEPPAGDQPSAPASSRDLVDLNTERTILDAVGRDVLGTIVADYLDLLQTASAVFEKNGDYACGVISSDWCRFLNRASRDACGTTDAALHADPALHAQAPPAS